MDCTSNPDLILRQPERLPITWAIDTASFNTPPKTGGRRFWSNHETAKLLASWPPDDFQALVNSLPGRSPRAIYSKASKCGLKSPRVIRTGVGKPVISTSPFIDEAIKRCWETGPTKGALIALALSTARSRDWLRRRAINMGLAKPLLKSPDWSAGEKDLLRANPISSPRVLQGVLKKAGFPHRTVTAILIQKRRLKIDSTDPNVMTIADISDMIGLSHTSVETWIKRGLLEAKQNNGGVRYSQWRVTRRALRQFIIANPIHINLRKVRDQEWFIDLLGSRD